jgi:hypothetical protein
MRRIAWTVFVAGSVIGCGANAGSGRPVDNDGQSDAGAQIDSGGQRDTGAQTDSGAPRDSGTPGDTAVPGDASGTCLPEVVSPPTAPGCAAATATCLAACADEACADNCFAADPNPDGCNECLEQAYLACVNAAGCQAAFDALMCCAEGCADPDAEECYTVTCAAPGATFDTCTEAHESGCDDSVCFPG